MQCFVPINSVLLNLLIALCVWIQKPRVKVCYDNTIRRRKEEESKKKKEKTKSHEITPSIIIIILCVVVVVTPVIFKLAKRKRRVYHYVITLVHFTNRQLGDKVLCLSHGSSSLSSTPCTPCGRRHRSPWLHTRHVRTKLITSAWC